MAGRIRDEDIALVRERVPIAEVVGEYLQLRNAGGGSLKGLCPFHEENSPSFNVSPGRGLFHCFGCGAGGDVISFVQQMEHLSFLEAVESLAQQAGVKLRYEEGGYTSRGDQGKRQRLLEANKAAQEFYAARYRSSQAAEGRTFLHERGFDTKSDAEHFGIGFAPPGWESLTRHLRSRGFTDKEIIDAGLASQGRRGPYDRFRNRLVWPVRDVGGEIVGFGARKLASGDDSPKYLNTPETLLFKKGQLLYGLDLAKGEISRRGEAVVVEGYTDVMACHLAGTTTAVATCGTSFGEEHAKILRRMLSGRSRRDSKVIFTFDGDEAGKRAALRSFEAAQGLGADGFVAVQPDGLDPCDLRRQHGDAQIGALIRDAQSLERYVLHSKVQQHNLDTHRSRLSAIDDVADVFATVRDAGLRDRLTNDLAGLIGYSSERDLDFVQRRIKELLRSGRGSSAPRSGVDGQPGPGRYDRTDPTVRRERQALKIAVQYPALAADFDQFDEDAFTVPHHRVIHELIRGQGGVAAADDPQAWVMLLRDAAVNDGQRAFIHELGVERIEVDGEFDEHQAGMILSTIHYHSAARREANIKAQVDRLHHTGDTEGASRVLADLMAAQTEKRQWRERSEGVM